MENEVKEKIRRSCGTALSALASLEAVFIYTPLISELIIQHSKLARMHVENILDLIEEEKKDE